MTVKELKAAIENLPDDMPVLIRDDGMVLDAMVSNERWCSVWEGMGYFTGTSADDFTGDETCKPCVMLTCYWEDELTNVIEGVQCD